VPRFFDFLLSRLLKKFADLCLQPVFEKIVQKSFLQMQRDSASHGAELRELPYRGQANQELLL